MYSAVRTMNKKIVVIGGGAAGMMAALSAAEQGAQVTLLEPNERLGKKLNITGKGRCNVTNDSAPQEFLQKVCTNARFLKSSLYAFPPETVKDFFEEAGAASACFPFPITPTTLPIRWSAWQKAPAFALSGNVLLTSGQRADTFPQR